MLRDDLTELPLGELSVLRKRIGDKKFARLYRSQGNEQEAEEGSQNVRESDEDNGAHHSRSLSDRSFPTSHRVSGFPSSTSRASVQKRENHNQPLEVSTRRPTAFKRERIREFCSHSSYLSHSRDPRFDERCGEFSEHAFGATFSFLDEMREKEKDQLERTKQHLKKALMKAKRKPAEEVNKGDSVDEGRTAGVSRKQEKLEKVNYLLERIKQRKVTKDQKALRKKVRDDLLKSEREQVASGKRPYFAKRSELRKLELLERFRQLRKAGRLDAFLKKKRKRESAKQKRKLNVTL